VALVARSRSRQPAILFHPGDADNWRRFTGLLLGSGVTVSDIQSVAIEFYRVFPRDSAFPPSGNVREFPFTPVRVPVA